MNWESWQYKITYILKLKSKEADKKNPELQKPWV